MRCVWEERYRQKKKDIAAAQKKIFLLKETIGKLERHMKDLYEAFALGESSKAVYLAEKNAAVQQKDRAAAQLAKLEAELENTGTDGKLQNAFVSNFEPYVEVKTITQEIVANILKEVLVYPGGRLEIIWNYQDEYEKLLVDLMEG